MEEKMIGNFREADSLAFNPHKWMGTNFDCSAWLLVEETARSLKNNNPLNPEKA